MFLLELRAVACVKLLAVACSGSIRCVWPLPDIAVAITRHLVADRQLFLVELLAVACVVRHDGSVP